MIVLREFLTALSHQRIENGIFFVQTPPGFSINFCSRPFFEIIRKLKSIEAFMSNVNAI